MYSHIEEKMKKTISVLEEQLGGIRAGRANPKILDKITVDYYGVPTPINQMANIMVPEARIIAIQPWDASMLKEIEKEIQKSDIGINPNNDGIDHHPTFVEADYQYKDIRMVGACATLIAEYFKMNHVPIDPNTAAALCYGIKVDTADFSRGVTDLDVSMFAYLYHHADKDKFSSMFANTMEFQDLKAYGAAIETIQICEHTGFSYIPFDCPDALVGMISDFILALNVVDVSVVYANRDNGLKFSVRSEVKEVNAGKITYEALKGIGSGGGHQAMAGGAVYSEYMCKLEPDIHASIRKRFMNAIGR